MWPDLSETCRSVVGDPPLNDNFIMHGMPQGLVVTFVRGREEVMRDRMERGNERQNGKR